MESRQPGARKLQENRAPRAQNRQVQRLNGAAPPHDINGLEVIHRQLSHDAQYKKAEFKFDSVFFGKIRTNFAIVIIKSDFVHCGSFLTFQYAISRLKNWFSNQNSIPVGSVGFRYLLHYLIYVSKKYNLV